MFEHVCESRQILRGSSVGVHKKLACQLKMRREQVYLAVDGLQLCRY